MTTKYRQTVRNILKINPIDGKKIHKNITDHEFITLGIFVLSQRL